MKKENDAIRNRITEFLQATHFSTKNLVNKPAMNNRRLLIAAVLNILYILREKTVKNITSWHKTLSALAVKVNNFQDAA